MPFLSKQTLAAAVMAALVTALVLGAVVLFVRQDDNAPIQVILPTLAPNGADSGALSSKNPVEGEIQVYVSGAVQNPGVYALRPNDRLLDAVDAAGGATGDAELEAVNLAIRVQDEGHYHIPRVGEESPLPGNGLASKTVPRTTDGDQASCGGLMDLTAASADLLETLPSIGQVRASTIVAFREKNGPFASVEQLTDISGIGPATYEKVRELVTVCDGQ